MDIVFSIRPLLAILVSLGAAALILASGRRPNLREAWTLLAAVAKFLIVLSMAPSILNGQVLEYTVLPLSPGISLQLRVDAFGLYFGLLASSLWIATSFYSIGYMRGLNEHSQTRYFFCFAVALSSTIGVAFAANLLTLFLFYEILTISTYPLVAHKETPEALAAGRKYLVYLLSAAVFILFSIAYTYQLAGSLDFIAGGFLKGQGSPETLRLLFVAFILGFGTKAALMPIHEWLPTAMIAPTPVSALLHAVAVVKAGVFSCLRVIDYVFGPSLLSDLDLWLMPGLFRLHHHYWSFSFSAGSRQPQKAPGFLHHQPALLHRSGSSLDNSRRPDGQRLAHGFPRLYEDHPLFLRRGHFCKNREGKHQPNERHRPANAPDHGCLCRGGFRDGRDSAGLRVSEQMVPVSRVHGGEGGGLRVDPVDQFPAQCGLLLSRRV